MDPGKETNIILIGAGAIGCFYGSRLHHPQHNIHVSLVARSTYSQIVSSGVRLTTRAFGDYTFRPAAIFPSVASAAESRSRWDFILVATKALPDRTDDAALIAPLVGPESAIVLLQNGVGTEVPYRRRFPSAPIVSTVAYISAEQISPGTVRQTVGAKLSLGPYVDAAAAAAAAAATPSATPPPRALGPAQKADLTRRGTRAAADLAGWWGTHGGLPEVDTYGELAMQVIRWHKVSINAALNTTAVLCGGLDNAAMVADGELCRHLAATIREIWARAPEILGLGVGDVRQEEEQQHPPLPVALGPPEAVLEGVRGRPGSRPSMLQDWEAGRPLEVEVILGNAVRMARARGVELPRTQTLYALMKSAQSQRDALGNERRGKM